MTQSIEQGVEVVGSPKKLASGQEARSLEGVVAVVGAKPAPDPGPGSL